MSIVTFEAKILLRGDEIESRDVWVSELLPLSPDKRPGQEWAEEHLQQYDAEDFRDMFSLGPFDYQILFQGRISLEYDSFRMEYDESLEILQSMIQPLPEDYYKETLEEVAQEKKQSDDNYFIIKVPKASSPQDIEEGAEIDREYLGLIRKNITDDLDDLEDVLLLAAKMTARFDVVDRGL